MQAEMIINDAEQEDIPEMVKLINSAYRGESSRKGWTTEADFLTGIRIDEEGLASLMENKNAVFKKISDGRRIIGSVYLEKQGDEIYLGMLTVDPELQSKGTGKLLLEEAETYARKMGASGIKMNVISLRGELIDWYKRHGYALTDERKPFPTDKRFGDSLLPLEFVILKKPVSPE